jgi:type IV pilus assembly protein PilA
MFSQVRLRAVLALSLCLPPGLPGADTYASVMDVIEPAGAEVLLYVNFEGDAEKLGGILNAVYKTAMANLPEAPPVPVDFTRLLQRTGFAQLRAIGLTGHRLDAHHHRTLSMLSLQPDATGIWDCYAREPITFDIAERAPYDVDMAIEVNFRTEPLLDMVTAIATDIMGPMGEALLLQQLAQPVAGTELTIRDLVIGLSGRSRIYLRRNTAAEMPFEIVVSLAQAAAVAEPLLPLAAAIGAEVEDDGTVARVLFPNPSEDPLNQAVLVLDRASGMLHGASNTIMLDQVLNPGVTLAGHPDYVRYSAGLPAAGLGMQYTSRRMSQLMLSELAADLDPVAQAVLLALDEQFVFLQQPTVGVSQHVDGGIRSIAYSGASTKAQLASALVMLPAAMAIPALQNVRATAQEKAVTNNLRQIASAAQWYMLENGVDSVSYAELSGPDGYFEPLEPVAGESYDNLVITSDSMFISVVLGNGRIISYSF